MARNKSFFLFTELPSELQLQIWECTLLPRQVIIQVSTTHADLPYLRDNWNGRPLTLEMGHFRQISFASNERPGYMSLPPALFVHRKSRDLTLPLYPWMFREFDKPAEYDEIGIPGKCFSANIGAKLDLGYKRGARVNANLDIIIIPESPGCRTPGFDLVLNHFMSFISRANAARIRHLVVSGASFAWASKQEKFKEYFTAFKSLKKISVSLNNARDGGKGEHVKTLVRMDRDSKEWKAPSLKFSLFDECDLYHDCNVIGLRYDDY